MRRIIAANDITAMLEIRSVRDLFQVVAHPGVLASHERNLYLTLQIRNFLFSGRADQKGLFRPLVPSKGTKFAPCSLSLPLSLSVG